MDISAIACFDGDSGLPAAVVANLTKVDNWDVQSYFKLSRFRLGKPVRQSPKQEFRDIRLVTVDLDDTLWPVGPLALNAEARMYEWLEANSPATALSHPPAALRVLKKELERANASSGGNFRDAMLAVLRLAMRRSGEPEDRAEVAFEIYWEARHEVRCFDDVMPALERLRKRYQLAAITNGVTDLARTELSNCFDFTLSASRAGCYKPSVDIFRQACRHAGVLPAAALHVGDDILCDVRGALAAGMHAAWVNRDQWSLRLLAPPAITVSDLVVLADRLEAAI